MNSKSMPKIMQTWLGAIIVSSLDPSFFTYSLEYISHSAAVYWLIVFSIKKWRGFFLRKSLPLSPFKIFPYFLRQLVAKWDKSALIKFCLLHCNYRLSKVYIAHG